MPTLTTKRILMSTVTNYHQSVWKTDNTSTGSSANNQIKLPLEATGTYNCVVDWGDGIRDTITVWNQAETTHTYSAIGTYTIKISGVCKGFGFGDSGDKLKLLSIQRWGKDFSLSAWGFFYGCENLTTIPSSSLTVSGIGYGFRGCTNLNSEVNFDTTTANAVFECFLFGCTSFNKQININTTNATTLAFLLINCVNYNLPLDIVTNNVTNMSYMLLGCSSFNQDISNLNIEKVTTMESMLQGATAWSTTNYDLALISWANQNVKNLVPFGCVTQYTLGGEAEAARNHLVNDHGWTITDAGGI